MPLIPYNGRVYVPPPVNCDDSGPISVQASFPEDQAMVCLKNDSGQYIYQRTAKISVTTVFPLDIIHPKYPPLQQNVIQIKTEDKDVKDLQAIVTWYPYCFNREATSYLKGHNNRSHVESLEIRERLCKREIPLEAYLSTNKYRDLQEPNSKILTAYFPTLRPSEDDVWSGQRRKTKKMTELLAFGFCENVERAVEEIYESDPKIRDIKAEVNPSLLRRFWKNHPCCRHLDLLSDKLIDPDTIERILKSAIKKALSGPMTNQSGIVGEPVATWARCVFLSTLYNLNRTKTYQSSNPQPDDHEVEPVPQEFMDLVASCMLLCEDWDRDWFELSEAGKKRLTNEDPHERRIAIALAYAIRDHFRIDETTFEKLLKMSVDDPDANVRDAALFVLKQLKAEKRN